MNVKTVILLIFLASTSLCLAQVTPPIISNLNHNSGENGRIELIQSEQIANLLMMQIENNRMQGSIPGFRIRIFSQSGSAARQNANNVRADFMRRFPDIEAYQDYNVPNFQIFVGDFRTKNEALRQLKTIERAFPGAFIIASQIDITK